MGEQTDHSIEHSFRYLIIQFPCVMCIVSRYLKERKQFGAPLAAFQLNQQKLVQMLGNVQAMFLMGWRLCKLYESGQMTPGQASLGKV